MAVPKKRKKLDKSEAAEAKKENLDKKKSTKAKASSSTASSTKAPKSKKSAGKKKTPVTAKARVPKTEKEQPVKAKKADPIKARPVKVVPPKPQQDEQKTEAATAGTNNGQSGKLDKAISIMENIDRKIQAQDALVVVPPRQEQANTKAEVGPTGINFKLSLDAVLPLKSGAKAKPEKTKVFDLGFNIPFIWDIPIIGPVAQQVIKQLNALRK